MPLRKPKGAARAARPLKDAGQTTVEHVVVIAIIIRLGAALTAFAATEKGSIADATNSVGNMFSKLSGPAGGGEGGGDEGAGGAGGAGAPGGSGGGTGSEIEALAQKSPQEWTFDEQKAVAEDIEKNGTASKLYEKAKAAMSTDVNWSIELTNGKTLEYKIIGINHDDLADGSGKAGLTFEAINDGMGRQKMNATLTNAGGWEKSELRGRLNTGDLWSLLPSELQSKVKAVTKMTDNKGGGSAGTPSATADKVFLLSTTEIYGDLQSDGTQYEYYKNRGMTRWGHYGVSWSSKYHWTRPVDPNKSENFYYVLNDGTCLSYYSAAKAWRPCVFHGCAKR